MSRAVRAFVCGSSAVIRFFARAILPVVATVIYAATFPFVINLLTHVGNKNLESILLLIWVPVFVIFTGGYVAVMLEWLGF